MSFRTGPGSTWNQGELAEPLASVRHRQGRLIGHMEALGFNLRQEAVLQTLTGDVVKSSEIEGEKLDAEQVRSSLARRLGMDVAGLQPTHRDVEGIVEMMLDATRRFDQPLAAERLFAWYSSLFPTGRSGMTRIRTGAWHDDSKGPMQVISGPVGREHVHFEAPKAERLDSEMGAFLDWFETATGHCSPGHPATRRERNPRAQPGRRAQHQLFSRVGTKHRLIHAAAPLPRHRDLRVHVNRGTVVLPTGRGVLVPGHGEAVDRPLLEGQGEA